MRPRDPDRRRPRPAFTLLELLVVVGLGGALAGILVPGLGAARRAARLAQCQANVRQIVGSVTAFAAANGGGYPTNAAFPAPGGYWYDPRRAGEGLGDAARAAQGRPGGGLLACPDDPEGIRSYAQNVWSCGAANPQVAKAQTATNTGWKAGAGEAAKLILVAEAWSWGGSAALGYAADPTVGLLGETAGQRFGGRGGLPPRWLNRWGMVICDLPYARHRLPSKPGAATDPVGRVTLGYADGHVAVMSDADLVDPVTGLGTGTSRWNPGERP